MKKDNERKCVSISISRHAVCLANRYVSHTYLHSGMETLTTSFFAAGAGAFPVATVVSALTGAFFSASA